MTISIWNSTQAITYFVLHPFPFVISFHLHVSFPSLVFFPPIQGQLLVMHFFVWKKIRPRRGTTIDKWGWDGRLRTRRVRPIETLNANCRVHWNLYSFERDEGAGVSVSLSQRATENTKFKLKYSPRRARLLRRGRESTELHRSFHLVFTFSTLLSSYSQYIIFLSLDSRLVALEMPDLTPGSCLEETSWRRVLHSPSFRMLFIFYPFFQS